MQHRRIAKVITVIGGIAILLSAAIAIFVWRQHKMRTLSSAPGDAQLRSAPMLRFMPESSSQVPVDQSKEILASMAGIPNNQVELFRIDLINHETFLPSAFRGAVGWLRAHMGPFVDDFDSDGVQDILMFIAKPTTELDFPPSRYPQLFQDDYVRKSFPDGKWRRIDLLIASHLNQKWEFRFLVELGGYAFLVAQPFEEYRRYLRFSGRTDPNVPLDDISPGLRIYSCLSCDGGTSRVFWDGHRFVHEIDPEMEIHYRRMPDGRFVPAEP